MRRNLVPLHSGKLSKARAGGTCLPRGHLCHALKSESGFAGQKRPRISGNAVMESRNNYGVRGAALPFMHSVGGGRKGNGIATL